MIKVANKKVLTGLAKKDYRQHSMRNLLTIIAIVLTTFMITAIFSLGISYWKSMTQRSIMLEGMKYDIILPEPTKEQVEKATAMKEVVYAGVAVKCAIIKKFDTSSAHIRLYWSDEINWRNQCIPAFEFVEGSYPVQENEIVMSTLTLKEMGIKSPQIGMELPVTYYDLSESEGTYEKTFILSGYYRDYTSNSKGFVSKSFYKKTGVEQTDLTQGRLYLTLQSALYTPEDIKAMEKDLVMGENQMLEADNHLMRSFTEFALGVIGLFFLIIFSGYLFIYNILYISISKEIRFYGQLKTIGTTSRQIKGFVHKQVLWNSFIGIPIGILFGATISFLVVPMILNVANTPMGIVQTVVFHPVVFIGSALFSFTTVFTGSRKPAVIAGNISPIEATKYVAASTGRKYRKCVNGSKLTHMAWRNIFRKKKQAIIIFLSFFIALTAFLSINVFIDGNNAGRILNTIYNYDIRILNQTQTMAEETPSQIIDDAIIEQIASMDEISLTRKVVSSKVIIPYDEDTLGGHFKRIFDLRVIPGDYQVMLERYKNNPDDPWFHGKIVGIDEAGFDLLNKELDGELNKEEFMSGKVGIIKGFLDTSVKETLGKEITFLLPDNTQKYSLEIAAECNGRWRPNYFAAGYAPDIIVSEKYADELLEEPIIELVDIDYKEPFNADLDEHIKKFFFGENEISFESKLDQYDEMKQSEGQMKVLGGGLGIILALLAILNYSNMIAAGVQNREKEFAALQSIGMTSRQLRMVLVLEGLGYGLVSILLVAVLGVPFSYLVFQFMNQYGVSFQIPILANGIVFGIILLICVLVPPVVYRFIQKDSIVEQLKGPFL